MDGELAGTPFRPLRLHRIYRLRVERDGDRVRLFSRGGHDWSRRFPWIVETARKIRNSRFILDGEAVVLGVDGISDFNALHSRKHDHEVQLYAFDCLAHDGDDLCALPLHLRKTNLAQLLRGRSDFDGLHSRKYEDEVQFYAFDILAYNGGPQPAAAQSEPGA